MNDSPNPRLLGPFDPVLHGWKSREWVVGDHGKVVTSNGIFRPIALVGGRAIATWGLADGTVRIEPFGRLTKGVTAALDAEAQSVVRYLAA